VAMHRQGIICNLHTDYPAACIHVRDLSCLCHPGSCFVTSVTYTPCQQRDGSSLGSKAMRSSAKFDCISPARNAEGKAVSPHRLLVGCKTSAAQMLLWYGKIGDKNCLRVCFLLQVCSPECSAGM
jgi:hypothetical protein